MSECYLCKNEAEISCYDCYRLLCKNHCIEFPITQPRGNVLKDSSITICVECAEKRRRKKKPFSKDEQDMNLCFLCDKEANAVCATCMRSICKIHRVAGYGKISCIACAEKGDTSQKRNAYITFILMFVMIIVMVVMMLL